MNLYDEVAQRGFTLAKNATAAMPGFGARHFVKTA